MAKTKCRVITERPILFSEPMVRAILDGRKTQTRRVVKPQPKLPGIISIDVNHGGFTDANDKNFPCRFVNLGDRIWVRETWATATSDGGPVILYRADGDRRYLMHEQDFLDEYRAFSYEKTGNVYFDAWASDIESADIGWKLSIHMPRWASRIELDITDVRVERVQDITEDDAIAEGAKRFDCLPSKHPFGQDSRWSMGTPTSTDQCLGSARYAFADKFNRINGQGSWDLNPWVWVIEFKQIK